MNMYQIIKYRGLWLTIAAVITAASIILFAIWGLKPGIDFTGGSLLEVKFTDNRPAATEINTTLSAANFGSSVVQPIGDANAIIRFQDTTEEAHAKAMQILNDKYSGKVSEERYESIGPSIGKELKTKAVYSILLAILAIVVYMAYSFRAVSWPVASWKYGVTAIIALVHDIFVVIGVFVLLGKFMNVEIDLPFIAALLTVLGYSVNDTIVVFDRVRENLGRISKASFGEIVNRSVNETMARSINTTLTTLLPLFAIFFLGGASIKFFALALLVGIFSGAYSSIFIASPLLVVWERWSREE